MADTRAMEVIELISDDEELAVANKINKGSKRYSTACINFGCESGKGMKTAPSFACSFYRAISTKKKKRKVCEKCLEAAIIHQEELVKCLSERKPLLQCDFPDHTMEVEISDSEDSDKTEETDYEGDYLPEDVLLDIEEKYEGALSSIFEKYDINHQVQQAHKVLKDKWDDIQKVDEETDKELNRMMVKLNQLCNELYEDFRPEIRMLEELQIDADPSQYSNYPLVATKKVTQVRIMPPAALDSQPEVLPLKRVDAQAASVYLPPSGPFIRVPPAVGDNVYILKHYLMPWVKAKVLGVTGRHSPQYRVKVFSKKNNTVTKIMNGKQIAREVPCSVIIPVATRVVAIFHDVNASCFYSGVIAEPPKSTNKYRYLVFFDDGYAQYVHHNFILLVAESSPRVWEDVPKECQEFVKNYVETYPERPMVRLQPGQNMKTEWNGKWWLAKVMQIDASLVQMHFNADRRTEWIYRGSARLGPLYMELANANARQQGHHRLPSASNKNNMPYVEYTSYNPEVDTEESLPTLEQQQQKQPQLSQQQHKQIGGIVDMQTSGTLTAIIPTGGLQVSATPQQTRAVAKKRTGRRPNAVESSVISASTESSTKPSHSIVYYQTQNKIQTKKYVNHKCGPNCVKGISFTPDDLRGYSPLSIPLLCGWNRQLCKFRKGKKVTLYQAPCGVTLRNMEELHSYLRITGSPMSVDLFDFDHWVRCLAEFVLDKCFVNIKDLSYGVENVPIPCVNELDHALPDTIRYSTQREPTEGVNINLDPEFLCSCDCEDDCQDKEKCACWQLTIQGATLGGRVPDNTVGYVYKRLPEPVTTGIYECNSRCKCSVKTCINRVVQHPLTLKLQVFKTGPRGWGIRCLNDIPLGSFICIYAGRLLTEQGANEGGKNYGDEYLAELDYVEVVEGIKEGYESDVLDPELPIDTSGGDQKDATASDEEEAAKRGIDSDEDFNIGRHVSLNINSPDTSTSIRRRLRRRKKEDGGSEDVSEDGSVTKDSENSITNPSPSEGQQSDYLITISDDEENGTVRREPSRFDPTVKPVRLERPKFKSARDFFGEDEAVYIMDAKTTGNIGRYLNHSCDPNVFVQNVFVDTHDVRFPWVAFFALNYITAGQELTWNYSYDVGSIPGKVIICRCGAPNCRGRLL